MKTRFKKEYPHEYQTLWGQLAVFRGLHSTALGKAFKGSKEALAAAIYAGGGDLGLLLLALIMQDENACIRNPDLFQSGIAHAQLQHELEILSQISRWQSNTFPKWGTTPQNFCALYPAFLLELPRRGFGPFARHAMFTLQEEGTLRGVQFPDPQRLDTLYGYARQRQPVVENTLHLLGGKAAQHVLLYGDAGTGKSATVKALANEYSDEGLRLIEVPKHHLSLLPGLLEHLGQNPLKFIIFIDDLRFAEADDNFSALKAVLEGGAGGYAPNYAVYATSNRRHLLKETMADREGSEVHLNDSLQETMSLSARFGLSVTFQRPEKESYLALVRAIAQAQGLVMEDNALCAAAERAALRRGGRTPRLAKQVVLSLLHNEQPTGRNT